MAKVSRPVLYGGLLVIAVIAWIATEPGDQGGPASSLKRGRGSSSSGRLEQFTKEDYEARFERLNEAPRNAFNPLVVRKDAGGGLMPNEFPASYTGGEAGWFYTGTVVVNDVPSALVENEVTGEGMYLKVGDRLKKALIAQIAPTYIVVRAAGGQGLRLNLLTDPDTDEGTGMGSGLRNLDVQPVRPDVPGAPRGPIRSEGIAESLDQRNNEES